MSPTNHRHAHSSGGASYGHLTPQGAADQHHAIGTPHHVAAKSSHSYGVPPLHMPPLYHERRERSDSRGYQMPLKGGSSGAPGGGGGNHSLADYERTKYEQPLPSTSYPPPGWSGDSAGSRGMSHDTLRSQSPPTVMRTAHAARNGGRAPRPTPTQLRGYDNQYPPSRYSTVGGPGDGFPPPGISVIGRRHSGSSLLAGRDTLRQDTLPTTNYFYPAGSDNGNEHAYDRDFSYAGPSRMA